MRKNLVVLSIVSALTLFAGFGFAGVGVRMHVSVPFDFYAGDQQLPAGEYEFEMGSGLLPTTSVITVRTLDGTGTCILNTLTGTAAGLSVDHLRFNKYGGQYFLSGLSINGFRAGFKTLKLEKELRTQLENRHGLVVLLAQK